MQNNVKNVEPSKELKAVIDKIADFILEYSAKHSISEPMSYDDIAHLISKEDYLIYFPLVAIELENRHSCNLLNQKIYEADIKAKEHNLKSQHVIRTEIERA